MVEAVAADAADQPSYDERVIALSLGSRLILEGIGLWDAIAPAAEPILRVHVSERGEFGFARLDQAELGVTALGYVTPVRAIGVATKPALAATPGIEWLCPAQLTGLRHDGNGVTMEVRGPAGTWWLHARLVVAADGGDSAVRHAAGIETKECQYGQDAIITTVTPDRPRSGWAF